MAGQEQNKRLGWALVGLGVVMLGAAYASVPLYQLFCQVTGFGGTAQRAAALPQQVSERSVTVSFNADVAPDLPWTIKPVDNNLTVRLGEVTISHYKVINNSNQNLVGTAAHNVQPERVGAYFNKVECFCYTEQLLRPGESKELPVTFFIDPDMAQDAAMADVQAVTLSYTFYLAKDQSLAKIETEAVAGAGNSKTITTRGLP